MFIEQSTFGALFDNYGIQQTYSQSAPEGYMLCFAHVRFRAKRGKFRTGNLIKFFI